MGPWGWTVFHLPSTQHPPGRSPTTPGVQSTRRQARRPLHSRLRKLFGLPLASGGPLPDSLPHSGFAACVEKLVAEEWSAARAGRRRTQWLAHPSS